MKIKEFIQQKFENAYKKQIDLVEQMQGIGFNIINCNCCDNILIHKTTKIEEEEKPITCFSCMEEIYPNDCSDVYYNGMEMGNYLNDFDMNYFDNSNLISYLEEIDKIDKLEIGMGFQVKKSVFYLFVNDEKFLYVNEKNRNDDMERIEEFLLTIKEEYMLKKKYCVAVVNLCDFIREDEDFKKLNGNLDDFLNSMSIDDFKKYLMDKKYIDISYFTSNNYVFDLDSIYLDYKAYIED